MDNQSTDRLTSLKSAILADLQPLIEQSGLDPERRFNLFLASARVTGEGETFEKARAAANELPDEQAKVMALMDLLEAVDEAQGVISFGTPTESTTTEPEPTQDENSH